MASTYIELPVSAVEPVEVIIDLDDEITIRGVDPNGVNRRYRISEQGHNSVNGIYDAVLNSDPSNIGLTAQERNAASADARQTMRPTAKRGAADTDTVSLDISLHDEAGDAFSNANPLPVSAASLPLPSGAATEAKQDVGNASLASIDSKIIAVDTDNVTVIASALPTGAATEAKQDVGNASLASLDGKTIVVDTSNVTVTASALPSGAATEAKQTQPGVDIGDVTVNNAAGASAVNIQDGGNSITVDGTVSAAQSGTWNINNVSGTVSLPTGAATESTLGTRLSESDFDTKTGSLTETAPATDTASSGLNGRLQRIAQRLTSLIALLPTSLGQKTMANSFAVVVASDQSNVPVSQATASSLNAQVVGNVADAAADSGNPIKVSGKVNTTAPTYTDGQRANLQQDTKGSLFTNAEGRRASYSASITGLGVAANPTDVFTITGAASTIVRITSIHFSAESTSNAVNDLVLLKRSTANSGGTSTTRTAVPYDSADAAAAATVRAYTVNPTTGTLVGNIKATKFLSSGASTQTPSIIDWIFCRTPTKPLVLRSASEVIALNLDGVTIAGSTIDMHIEWTEEAI